MKPGHVLFSVALCLLLCPLAFAQNYPDQCYVLHGDSLLQRIQTSEGVIYANDSIGFRLQEDRLDGYVTFIQQFSQFPFNEGLPSWNGSAPDSNSAFLVQIRFPYGSGWSPWLTVGYWKAQIWGTYGATRYSGGYIDIDNAKLYSYVSSWQFMITMKRTSLGQRSPTLRKLSFIVSDSRTTSSCDYAQILSDKPAALSIPTDFIYQYGVDRQIGGSICSPTSVAMIMRSYGIPVDPLQFARDTYDPYFDMFGIWPRAVQNASQYGLDGAVTRYRTWSEAYEVLKEGGRIAVSVGPPLYSGHLMMLAGFTASGDPIVHDPARSDGYSHLFSKSDLSHSWFDKGGVAYTFYRAGAGPTDVPQPRGSGAFAQSFRLAQNYPNPFNPTTRIEYQLAQRALVTLAVYDVLGREVRVLLNEEKMPGSYQVEFDGAGLASGVYFYRLTAGRFGETRKMFMLQ